MTFKPATNTMHVTAPITGVPGVCLRCGRTWDGHAANACYERDASGIEAPEPGQVCPAAPDVWCGSPWCEEHGCLATEDADGSLMLFEAGEGR